MVVICYGIGAFYSHAYAYDIDVIEKTTLALSLSSDAPHIHICAHSDVWSVPRLKTLMLSVTQNDLEHMQTQATLDDSGCYLLELDGVHGTVHVRAEYPGDAWSLRTVSETDISLPEEPEPEADAVQNTDDAAEGDILVMRRLRFRLLYASLGMFLGIALFYRFRKHVFRLLKRVGWFRPALPPLPTAIVTGSDVSRPVQAAPEKQVENAVQKATAEDGKTGLGKMSDAEARAAYRAHVAACFDAVVRACGERMGWGEITPASFEKKQRPHCSDETRDWLERFCLEVEKLTFDPSCPITEDDVRAIHGLAEKLLRRLG